jgi:hypothetical protein
MRKNTQNIKCLCNQILQILLGTYLDSMNNTRDILQNELWKRKWHP